MATWKVLPSNADRGTKPSILVIALQLQLAFSATCNYHHCAGTHTPLPFYTTTRSDFPARLDMSSYSHSREEGRDPRGDESQYSSYGDDNVAPRLRRGLNHAQRTSLQLLDAQKESSERIRELEDNNHSLQEEVANMRAQLSFATGTIINEIQDKVDTATFAGSTVHALKEQVADQTDTIQQLKTYNKRLITEIVRLNSQSKKKRKSSKSSKIKKEKPDHHVEPFDADAAATTPSPITATAQAPAHEPSAQVCEPYVITDVMRERLIEDGHLTLSVMAQFQQALSKRNNEGKNLFEFIHQGRTGRYYCFHEVCEKGPRASVEQRLANGGCKLGSDKCNFLVKAVSVGSHRKLQIYNPA
ncbi:hypothetical protein CEK26_006870 [Fusarium fujikuroi]|nr:hypothetical protein CEK26_006870 [Fusarium fujikuroi]